VACLVRSVTRASHENVSHLSIGNVAERWSFAALLIDELPSEPDMRAEGRCSKLYLR